MIDGLEEMGLPPQIGDNQPPPDAILRARELVPTVNRWLAERPVIQNAEQAGAAQLLFDQLRACRDDLDASLKKDRAPFDDAILILHAVYGEPQQLVGISLEKMRPIIKAWLDREDERLKGEAARLKQVAEEATEAANAAIERAVSHPSVEAERAAQQATKTALMAEKAAGKPPERAQVRGEFSARAMSMRPNWKARITDEAAAIQSYADHPDILNGVRAQIIKTATREAKMVKDASKAPAGVEFYNDASPA